MSPACDVFNQSCFMKKMLLLFFFAFSSYQYAAAQNMLKIQEQLQFMKADTAGVRLLNNIATTFYINNEYDSCEKYGKSAFQLASKLLNTSAAKNNPVYNRQCRLLQVMAIENIQSAMSYPDFKQGIDSLKAVIQLWETLGDKKGVASVYARLGEKYIWQPDYPNAKKFLDTSLKMYKELNSKYEIANTLYLVGLNERYAGNYGDALENNTGALNIGREIKDTTLITTALLSNGFIYMYVKEYSEALKNEQEALEMLLARNDSAGIATVYSDMGNVNKRAGKLDEALKYHHKALEIRQSFQREMNLGSTYQYISEILQLQGNYKEALSNSISSLKNSKSSGILSYILDSYIDIGNIYHTLRDDTHALQYYDSALQLSERNDYRSRQAEILKDISAIYLVQGKTSQALSLLNRASTIVDSTDFKNRTIIFKSLSEAYAKTGNYKEAYENSIKYKQFNDSFVSREKALKIAGITNQMVFENKMALLKASQDKKFTLQQAEIEKQKMVRNITIAGLLLAIILAFIILKRYNEKKRLNASLKQTLDNLKSAQAQLIQSEKMANLGELTAGISHEIQNPLNFVNNFSEVSTELLDELKVARSKTERDEQLEDELISDIKQNLEKINHHGKRAGAIVKSMLQHARQSKGIKEATDINALCDECYRLCYQGLRAKNKSFNTKFITDFDESIQTINVVPQDIGRVIINLITNAFYAVNERSKQAGANYQPCIQISTKKINEKIEIIIGDNGGGIPQHVLDKIFQPFFTTKPTGEGTGLGLSLSYDIVTAHGGEINVESKENEGTTFKIYLPLAEPIV